MKQTSLIVDIHNLATYKNGIVVPAKYVRIYKNGEWINIRRILANDNLETVWQANEYLLQANDSFTMPPNGGIVESNLSILSRLNKPDGTYDWVEYTVSPSNISPNTGTTLKEHEITITQKTSNLQITATCIQESDVDYGIIYETPVVTSVTAATAEASGEDVMLTVKYTQKAIHQYASGNKEETINGTINPTITSGSAKISNVTRNGKYIEVPSAGSTLYTSDRTVYTVTGYSFTVNGKTKNVTGVSIDVKQEANTISYGSWKYSISASAPNLNYDAAAVPLTATVISKRSRTCIYTSGYDPNDDNNLTSENYGWTASITSGSGNSVTSSGSAGTTTAQITLGGNTSTTSNKTTVVTFKSAGDSSKTSTLTFTQSKDSVASSSVSIRAHSVNAMQALASGGTVDISMTLKVDTTPIYSSGATGSPITTYPSATVTSFVGSPQNNSGATKDGSGTKVNVKSAGTDVHSSAWTVYKITSVTGTYEGKSYTWSGTLNVQQEANVVKGSTESYGDLSISANPTSVPPANYGSVISVTCYKNVKDVYTSGAYGDPVRENAEASITSSTGTFYPHSPIMGGNTTTFSPYENSTNQKVTHTVNASVKIGGNTYTDSCTIIQDPVSYEFEVKPLSISGISYLGQSDIKVNITSIKNGNQWDISRSNISVSGGTGLTYDIALNDVSAETGAYVLTINVGANSTTTAKTFYVTVTQPESGNSETITIYQAAKPSSGGGTTTNAKATIEAYFLGGDYSAVRANIELNEDAVTLGKTKNVIVELQNVTNDVIDSYTNSYPISSSFENTLANSNMESDVWVVVKCDNIELGRVKVEE